MANNIGDMVVSIVADNAQFNRGIDTSKAKFEAFGKSAVAVGKSLTLFVTGPILAAGAAMVKFASDTAESLNAATVVFGDSTSIITEWGKNAATQAGLSAAEFYQAGAVIGAGLQQAGASAEQAANQTIDLTKRAADMASIFNTSVNDALVALQSGLRGESEPLRRFAVNLNEAAVVAKAVALGLAADTNSVSDYARSQARLAIIMEQTNRFQGDFVNTSDGLANGLRVTTAQLKEVAAEMGEQLLPIVLDVLKVVKELVDSFAGMSDEGQKTVLVVAAIAAAIGPLIGTVGRLIPILYQLKIAFAALGGPLSLGIAAVAATVALVAVNTARAKREQLAYNQAIAGQLNLEETLDALAAKRRQVAEITARIALLGNQVGRQGVGAALQAAQQELAIAQGQASQLRQVADGYVQQNNAQILVANSAREVASAMNVVINVSEETAVATEEITTQVEAETEAIQASTIELGDYLAGWEAIYQAANEGLQAMDATGQKIGETADKQKDSWTNLISGLQLTSGLVGSLKTAIDGLDVSVAKTLGGVADIVSQIALATGTAAGAIVAGAAQLVKGIVEVFDSIFNQARRNAEAIEALTLETNSTIVDNQIKTLNLLNNEEKAARDKRLKDIQEESDIRLKAIDDALQAELEALGLQDKSEAERLRDEIATAERRGEFAKKKALEEELAKAAIFEKYELQREAELAARAAQEAAIAAEKAAAEEAYQKQLRQYNREKAIADKAITVAQIQIAQQKALADLGFFASASQKASVNDLYSKLLASVNGIPIPNLAQGAIIQPRAGGTMVNVAEAGVPEIVGPIDKVTQMLQTMGSGVMGGAEGNIHLVVNMEGKPFLDKIFQATRNRTVLISAGAIV